MRWDGLVGGCIATGVLILAVVGGVFLTERTRGAQSMTQQSEAEVPDMRVQNVRLIEQQLEDRDGWEMLAHDAEFYDAKQLVIVHQMRAQLLSQAAQPVQIVADNGRIDSATGDMTVQGNVQLQYLGGYTIETEVLSWHAANRLLWTDAAVKINSALVHIAGMRLQGNVDQQRFVLQDDVHAAFQLR
jgi:LPS export ABC transporter protein LptC